MTTPEPHAIARLRERYGVSITLEQLRWIASQLADRAGRCDRRQFGFISRPSATEELWLVNLERYAGRPLWVPAIFLRRVGEIATFLPRRARQMRWRRKAASKRQESTVHA